MPDYYEYVRYLTEGSIWLDASMRTIVVHRVHWANAVNVGSFDLLIIPDMKIVHRPAWEVEKYVREGLMQYCKDCARG